MKKLFLAAVALMTVCAVNAQNDLIQPQTSKPMVRVRNTALENKVISFSETAAEEIENRQYTKEFNDEFGTYVSAVVMQNFIDIETFKNYIKNEYPYKTNTEILLDWLNAYENSFNEVIRPLCKEENPYSPEEVLKHIETFNLDFINDRGKGRYFNVDKPSIDEKFKPSTPLEWSNYIATCLCCLESWIFLTGLGFNMYSDDAREFYKVFKTALPK